MSYPNPNHLATRLLLGSGIELGRNKDGFFDVHGGRSDWDYSDLSPEELAVLEAVWAAQHDKTAPSSTESAIEQATVQAPPRSPAIWLELEREPDASPAYLGETEVTRMSCILHRWPWPFPPTIGARHAYAPPMTLAVGGSNHLITGITLVMELNDPVGMFVYGDTIVTCEWDAPVSPEDLVRWGFQPS